MSAWPALAGAVGTACAIRTPVEPREPIDWTAFRDLAVRHRVEALVHHSGWARAHGAPENVCQQLASTSRRTVRETLRHVAAQREVVDVLEAADIPVVVLKGPVVGLEAYGDALVRDGRDVDVLVAPADVAMAAEALERHGLSWRGLRVPGPDALANGGRDHLAFTERLPLLKDVTLTWRGVTVEVHWRLTENERLMPVEAEWLRDPRRVAVADVLTPVLPFTTGWRYLLVHGSCHRWMRLKWLADVTAIALRHPALVTRDALARLTATGLERCVASGLLVAERVLGRFLTDEAREWARSMPGTTVLVRSALASLASPEGAQHGVSAVALPRAAAGRLLLRGDRGYRLAEARGMLLEAGQAHTVPDPRASVLLAGPARWAARRLQPRTMPPPQPAASGVVVEAVDDARRRELIARDLRRGGGENRSEHAG